MDERKPIISQKFKENFLTSSHWRHSFIWILFYYTLCIIFSVLDWNAHIDVKATHKLIFDQHEYWRLFTSALVHGDLNHLLSNGPMIFLMGHFVCAYYSPYIHPLGSLIIGGVINLIVLKDSPENMSLVGVSGVVYFLWGFWLTLFFFIQTHLSVLKRVMKVTIVGLFIIIPTEFQPNVSYMAHFIGLLIGILSGLIYWLIKKSYFKSFEQFEFITTYEPDFADEAENALSLNNQPQEESDI